jgi:hypothetical protein
LKIANGRYADTIQFGASTISADPAPRALHRLDLSGTAGDHEGLNCATPQKQVRAVQRRSRAPAFPVSKLSQNPIYLTRFGIRFERKQMPRIVGNVRKALNAREARESARIRPRQVRYQAALRPDFNSCARHAIVITRCTPS